MNDFELFTMVFYAVDSYYEDNPSNELGAFLGMMSPFTFKEMDSANSAIFSDFQKYPISVFRRRFSAGFYLSKE